MSVLGMPNTSRNQNIWIKRTPTTRGTHPTRKKMSAAGKPQWMDGLGRVRRETPRLWAADEQLIPARVLSQYLAEIGPGGPRNALGAPRPHHYLALPFLVPQIRSTGAGTLGGGGGGGEGEAATQGRRSPEGSLCFGPDPGSDHLGFPFPPRRRMVTGGDSGGGGSVWICKEPRRRAVVVEVGKRRNGGWMCWRRRLPARPPLFCCLLSALAVASI